MRRYDLRHLGAQCLERMREIITQSEDGEVSIFLFELVEFDLIQKSADLALECGAELVNSIRFNEKDWTFVVRKSSSHALQPSAQSTPAQSSEAKQ